MTPGLDAELTVGAESVGRLPLGAAPLHAVPGAEAHPESARLPSAALTWLLDGAGWTWIRPAADLLALIAGVMVAAFPDPHRILGLAPLVVLSMVLFCLRGTYRYSICAHLLRAIRSAVAVIAPSAIALAAWHVYVGGGALPEPLLIRSCLLALAFLIGARFALAGVRRLGRTLGLVRTSTLIVGAGDVGTRIAARLLAERRYGLVPIGFLDSDVSPLHGGARDHLPLLGGSEDLDRVLRDSGAGHVVISFAGDSDRELVPLVHRCHQLGITVSLVPRLFESRLTADAIGPLPLCVLQTRNPRGMGFAGKHLVERLAAAAGLVLLAPLLAAVAAAIKISSPGPVLFRQRRVGQDGAVFEMLKFRSMRSGVMSRWEGPTLGLAPGGVEGEDRRTPVGRFLRQTSIDELPQLWNVLRGDMSLVGPRPERPEYVARFRGEVERYDERHRVKCGITGAAQVNGLRGKTGLADRIEWDNYYIDQWTPALDLKILVQTIWAVLHPVE